MVVNWLNNSGLHATDQEHGERKEQIKRTNVFVIGCKHPPPPTMRCAVVIVCVIVIACNMSVWVKYCAHAVFLLKLN
jgi:hypothetical protein